MADLNSTTPTDGQGHAPDAHEGADVAADSEAPSRLPDVAAVSPFGSLDLPRPSAAS
jgi:hypothetical protein